MAGNTIAKLAVVVTTDTGPMAQGFRRGSDIIKKSAADMDGKFNRTANSLKFLKDAAGASTGSVRDMVGVLRSGAGPAGLLAVGVAALAVGMYKSAAAADALAMRAVKVADEWEAAHEKLTGQKVDIGFNKADTWTGQWERLKESALQFFAIIGENSGIYQAFINATETLANVFENLNQALMSDEHRAKVETLKRLEKETAEKKKQFDLNQKMAKEAEAAAKKAAEEHERAWESMRRTAEQITLSLRKPDEIFRDTVSELKSLAGDGLLSSETLARGIQKAKKELDDATKKAQDKIDPDVRVGAVERFTAAGFSAMQRTNEQKKIEENTKVTAVATTRTSQTVIELANYFKTQRQQTDLMVSNF